jgi:hypothetical protein
MEVPQDLISLFSEFAEGGVRYLVVGGHAVAAHGRPRSTKDVDIWLDSTPENIAHWFEARNTGLAPRQPLAKRGAKERRLTIG